MLTNEKQKSLTALKKAKGLIEKIIKMNEEDVYCVDIIQQIEAAQGLLKSTKKTLLMGHLGHCLANKIVKNTDKEKTIQELIKVYNLTTK